MTSKGLKTVDGIEHHADVIIFATGFDLEVILPVEILVMVIMMMRMVTMVVLVIMMVLSRQAQNLIPKKGCMGSWLQTMGMRPQPTWVV